MWDIERLRCNKCKVEEIRRRADNYSAMKRYAAFMMGRCSGWSPLQKPVRLDKQNGKFLVNRGQSYGEWAEPDDAWAYDTRDFIFPHPEESTAYTCFTMEHMAEIAAR